MRLFFCIVFLGLLACSEAEPPKEPLEASTPSRALSLVPTPAKIRSLIHRMNKDIATQEESALVVYAKEYQEIVLPELLEATKDPRAKVRSHIVRVLELIAKNHKIHTEEMVDALVPLLNDPDQWVPIKAADALGEIKSPKTIPILIEQLENSAVERAEAARQALVKITGQKQLGKKASAWKKWWEKNKEEFVRKNSNPS